MKQELGVRARCGGEGPGLPLRILSMSSIPHDSPLAYVSIVTTCQSDSQKYCAIY